MNTVELFCGTKSFSHVAEKRGYSTFTVDNDPQFDPDMVHDLSLPSPKLLLREIEKANVIWMSPPCTSFSMAAGNKHWSRNKLPRTEEGEIGRLMLGICEDVGNYCIKNKKIFFIENPRARARWFLPKKWRRTVWYCRYGDFRAKPTDIWTNLDRWVGRSCRNNNHCCHHESAPRGSNSGTQRYKNSIERGCIPHLLFEEIFTVIEKKERNFY